MDENANVTPEGVASQSANQPTNNIPGAAPGETKAETMARMYKVVVDGAETEVDEKELLRGYSHAKAAEKKMQEAANSRKEATEALRIMKENPKLAMEHLGLNPRQFAEMIINEELAEAMLSPEQKQLRDYKRELEQYQNNEKQAREEYEREQYESEMAKYTESIQSEIGTAMVNAGLPNTQLTVSRTAYYMQAAIAAGFTDVTPRDVIDHVKNDYIAEYKSMLGVMSEEQIETFLGTDILRKAAKATVKTGMPISKVDKSVNENKQIRETMQKKPTSPREYFKRR